MHKLILLLGLILITNSCYVSKSLESPVKVKLDTQSIQFNLEDDGQNWYLKNYTKEEYLDRYKTGLRGKLSSNNVVLVESGYQYLVRVREVKFTESHSSETVDDPDSEYHGKSYELASVDLEASGEILDGNGRKVQTWWADKGKNEKVKNSRNFGDLVLGNNKDNNTYRMKNLSDDVFLDKADDLGRRSGVRIINDLVKLSK